MRCCFFFRAFLHVSSKHLHCSLDQPQEEEKLAAAKEALRAQELKLQEEHCQLEAAKEQWCVPLPCL
jgi:hypothetical protein